MSVILKLERVWKSVHTGDTRTDILRGVTLSVRAGEFVAIMGPSGSGKSTLLNVIGLLDIPTSGEILLDGQRVADLPEDQLCALRARAIGFIFQNFNLLPYLTARQNVALPMSYQHVHHQDDRVENLLARVNLLHRASAFPTTLSGGEKQRVAIARALVNSPMLLLADEPTGALDTRTGKQILELLGEFHKNGVTVLLITHDESVARRAERVLVMRDGAFE